MNKKIIPSCIDHTLLKPDVSFSQINQLCQEARKYDFHSVCVNPSLIKETTKHLKSTPVKICSVVGFPLGANISTSKLMEIETCLNIGASEIDMVMNIGLFKDGKLKIVSKELKESKQLTGNNILKIIIETSLLTKEEIITASKMVETSGADFIKTSTGFSSAGATTENVLLIRNSVGPEILIKASGGIKSLSQAQAMLDAGASRIGTSAGVRIMKEISLI